MLRGYEDFSGLYETRLVPMDSRRAEGRWSPRADLRMCEGMVIALEQALRPDQHDGLVARYAHETWLAEADLMQWEAETLAMRDLGPTDPPEAYAAAVAPVGGAAAGPKAYHLARACHRLLDPGWAERPLTPELACDVHRLLMEGWAAGGPGELRTRAAFSGGGTAYLLPSRVPLALDRLCAFARERLPAHRTFASRFHLAAWFVLDFLAVHPFANGNGRTARLLFAHLMRDVAPVPLGFHHRGAAGYADYIDAIRAARLGGGPAPFLAYALVGVRQCLGAAYDEVVFAPDPV